MKRRVFLAASALPLGACQEAAPRISGGFNGVSSDRGHVLRGGAIPTPGKTRRARVLVAGGGVAGLAAARALRLRGIDDVAVLELEDSAGGNSRGGMVNGLPCPLGAHYLPVPGDSAPHVQNLLEELGLRRRAAGRWVYDERHLCHSPQERLFINGQWREGLLPQEVDAATLDSYRRFSALVKQAARDAPYTMPAATGPLASAHAALDAITFEAWLNRQQLSSPALRWYLDYCCRDDYGAGLASVSAWAGIHYFASRHGFSAPGETGKAGEERDAGVLTWPEGNGWLTRRLAQPLGERLQPRRVVVRVASGKHGVEVDALDTATGSVERWQAAHCILAMPLFVAARVVENPPPALREAAARLRYAPWLVANIHIKAALHDRPGAPPSWDNVIYDASPQASGYGNGNGNDTDGAGLGYVDAGHQNLATVPGATVLTHYRAFGLAPAARKALLEQPWSHWRDILLQEMAAPHPDLREQVSRIDITRYGHAMSSPLPGTRGNGALRALQQAQAPAWARLHFAHSDLSGYSVFEEAFTHGHLRGDALAQALRKA
ncbi:MAG: FAD-dependent oxidoreductase [Pseudomonadota bacterium]